ncbi:MAG: methyltransferase [Erythrobacter sp.]
MIKPFLFGCVGAFALAACSPATESESEPDTASAAAEALETVLASDLRAEDKARDTFRNPAETLSFFQVEPDHTVIEYAPGGGWYTRILAPLVNDAGNYIAVSFPPSAARESLGDEFVARIEASAASFSQTQSESLGIAAERLPFHFGDSIPETVNGTVDRVLIVRMMHNLKRWGIDETEIAALRSALKPDGLLGVVQHRAQPDASDEFADGNRGYLREADLIAFFEGQGFELVDTSELNANPNDPTTHENGVWALPPSFAGGEETAAEFEAIGESDRMTLLFRKAE